MPRWGASCARTSLFGWALLGQALAEPLQVLEGVGVHLGGPAGDGVLDGLVGVRLQAAPAAVLRARCRRLITVPAGTPSASA